MKYLLLIAAFIGASYACVPGAEKEIDLLNKVFGLTATEGANDANGVIQDGFDVNSPISNADELDCDFSDVLSCGWTNMDDTPDGETVYRKQIDAGSDYFLFDKSSDKKFSFAIRPGGPDRTPKTGEKFLLAGGKTPTRKAVWISKQILCLKDADATLAFDYWLYGGSRVRVIVLDSETKEILWEQSEFQCYTAKPKDGRCVVPIPTQDKPFHLGIQSVNLRNAFVLVDNIDFTANLEPDCVPQQQPTETPTEVTTDVPVPTDPFDFGTTTSPLGGGATGEPIEDMSDLECSGDADCRWANADSNDAQWMMHSGTVDKSKWAAAFGTEKVPDGSFYMVDATSKQGRLVSDPIACQENPGFLQYSAWLEQGATLEVCPVDADTLQKVGNCYPAERNAPDALNFAEITDLNDQLKNFRIMFIANGGHVAIDDVDYAANLCPADGGGGEEPTPEQCQAIQCNFEDSNTCSWVGSSSARLGSPWEPRTGRTGNYLTGIREGDGVYIATYVYAGETTILTSNLPRSLASSHAVSFKYYDATDSFRVRACCDSQDLCPWSSELGVGDPVAVRNWRSSKFECPEETSKLIFLCENLGKNQGACGLDEIQVVNADSGLPLCSE